MCACRPARCCSTAARPAAATTGWCPTAGCALDDFELDDAAWEELRMPVDMAFFFHSTPAERVVALLPEPDGRRPSRCSSSRRGDELEAANPVLGELEPDVEALLVNRARGAREHWLVPIDECYALVGLIRTRWRGLTGGREVWQEIGRFFDGLDRRSGGRTATAAHEAGHASGRS